MALKIINVDTDTHEHQILHHLQASSVAKDNVSHPGRNAVIHLHDDFNLGTSHKGLVLDVMGADVQSRAGAEYGRRLTKKTARSIACQVALGLDYLWKCGVAHGGEYLTLIAATFANSNDINQDLYGRNILFTAPAIATISEEQIMSHLGIPKIGPITRRDGHRCEPSMPSYLVRPASIRGSDTEIKIVDLGNGSAQLDNMPCAELTRAKRFFTIIRQNNSPPLGMYERQKLSTVNH